MIDLRMVADNHGYMQLQSRGFCVQRGWTEWKSVPIVHDPAQLVDRVEIFDAKSSGAKPDGGLTAAQVAKILKEFETMLERHQIEANKRTVYPLLTSFDVKSTILHHGVVAGIGDCLSVIRAELSPQPAEPEIDL